MHADLSHRSELKATEKNKYTALALCACMLHVLHSDHHDDDIEYIESFEAGNNIVDPGHNDDVKLVEQKATDMKEHLRPPPRNQGAKRRWLFGIN